MGCEAAGSPRRLLDKPGVKPGIARETLGALKMVIPVKDRPVLR
jgi:hypothetical protein